MPITAGEIRTRFHRFVQSYAADRATSAWGLSRDEWGRANLAAAQRLAQHLLALPDDDPRFVRVSEVYNTQEWGVDRFPTRDLAGWLSALGGSGASGVPNDPDEFVTAWLSVEARPT